MPFRILFSVILVYLDSLKKTNTQERINFSSPGTHTITVEDPNRNAGIININSSDQIVFALKTVINISAFLGPNSSIQFDECPCPEIACVNKPYTYNPMGYDPDGDSLSYELVSPLGQGAIPLANTVYTIPNLTPQNSSSAFGIDNIFLEPYFGIIQ